MEALTYGDVRKYVVRFIIQVGETIMTTIGPSLQGDSKALKLMASMMTCFLLLEQGTADTYDVDGELACYIDDRNLGLPYMPAHDND